MVTAAVEAVPRVERVADTGAPCTCGTRRNTGVGGASGRRRGRGRRAGALAPRQGRRDRSESSVAGGQWPASRSRRHAAHAALIKCGTPHWCRALRARPHPVAVDPSQAPPARPSAACAASRPDRHAAARRGGRLAGGARKRGWDPRPRAARGGKAERATPPPGGTESTYVGRAAPRRLGTAAARRREPVRRGGGAPPTRRVEVAGARAASPAVPPPHPQCGRLGLASGPADAPRATVNSQSTTKTAGLVWLGRPAVPRQNKTPGQDGRGRALDGRTDLTLRWVPRHGAESRRGAVHRRHRRGGLAGALCGPRGLPKGPPAAGITGRRVTGDASASGSAARCTQPLLVSTESSHN